MLLIFIVNTGWQERSSDGEGAYKAIKAMAQIWKGLFHLTAAQENIKGQFNWDPVKLCILLALSSLSFILVMLSFLPTE